MVDIKHELNLLSEEELAKLRDIHVSALRNERAKGLGPPFVRIGRQTFYPLDKLRKYVEAATVIPTSRPPTLIDGTRKSRANVAA